MQKQVSSLKLNPRFLLCLDQHGASRTHAFFHCRAEELLMRQLLLLIVADSCLMLAVTHQRA